MTLVDALQQVLTTEYAAIYGYGLLGARLAGTELGAAGAAYAAHQARRDATLRLVRDLGADPVAAPPAYRPRAPLSTRRSVLDLAVALEDDGAAAYVVVLGATSRPEVRRSAVSWLTDATVRGQQWRAALGATALAAAPALPGLVEPVASPTSTPPGR